MKRILQICLLSGGLLFFGTTLYAQCLNEVRNLTENNLITLTDAKVLGQSFTATCNGRITSIQVRSNTFQVSITNVQLKLWEGIGATGQQVKFTQNGITLNGQAAPTIINVTEDNEITALNNYYFTLHADVDLDLHAQSTGTYGGGQAVDGNLMPIDEVFMLTDLIFEIEADVLLPVELTHFSAKLQSDRRAVQLDWSTASEIENRGFAIEKSTDGQEWKEIGFVSGAGNSDFTEYYDFMDDYPFPGTNYYRLKQMDFNGAFEYLQVEVVEIKSDRPLEVYPNPARDYVNVIIAEGRAGEQIQILDALCRPVIITNAMNAGVNQIAIDQLPKGVYSLHLSSGISSRFMIID